jgi:hypothetical protein
MSEIPFLTALGDALSEMAVRDEGAVRPVTRRSGWAGRPRRIANDRRLLLPTRRARVALTVAALVLGGSATASVLLAGGPTRSASITGIECINSQAGQDTYNVYGPDPIAACRGAFPAFTRLIACLSIDPAPAVVVTEQGDDPSCRGHGYRPLPRQYATDVRDDDALARAMLVAWRTRDCWAPSALVRKVDGLLTRRGWYGWHAELVAPRFRAPGGCGAVAYTGSGSIGTAVYGSLLPDRHVVWVQTGPPLSVRRHLYAVWRHFTDAAPGCLTASALYARLRSALRNYGLASSLAVTRQTQGQNLSLGTRREGLYSQGCAVLAGVGATARQRVAVWIIIKGAPPARLTPRPPVRPGGPYPGPPFQTTPTPS